jgi:hypothetical protein
MTHAPVQLARQEIDHQLAECGWLVQDHASTNTTDEPCATTNAMAVNRAPSETHAATSAK